MTISPSHTPLLSSSAQSVPDQPSRIVSSCRSNHGAWCYYQNVRGLRTKTEVLYLATNDCSYDVVILTETGLTDSFDSAQIFGNQYAVFRCDRSPRNSVKKSFGGVLIAVKQCHASSFVDTENGNELEQVCVAATINGKRFLFCAVYIPPDKSCCAQVVESHVASIRELYAKASRDDSVLVCGDYNQPRLMWEKCEIGAQLLNVTPLSAAASCLIDGTNSLSLSQFNAVRNHVGRTLDLVFGPSEEKIDVSTAPEVLVPVDLYHPPIVFDLPVASTAKEAPSNYSIGSIRPLNFRKTNFALLSQYLISIDWDAVLSNSSVDSMTETFCILISNWLNEHVPRFKPPVSPAWSTPTLRQLRREKNVCLRRLRKNRTEDCQAKFGIASTAYRRLNASLYKLHVMRLQSGLRSNPRSFWKFVNSKRKSNAIPSSVFFHETVANSPQTCCDLFAEHFRSVFSDNASTARECIEAISSVPIDAIDFNTFEVNQEIVEAAAKKLKSSFAPGPDGIPSAIYCRCIEAVSSPLARIFNRSFQQRKFPEMWKTSFMFPIFKTGERRNVKQYRGITSLSAGSKLFEIIVSQALLQASLSYIALEQHGFMPGRSVCTNLVEYTSLCLNQLENKKQVDAIYTDIKAAFDAIDHQILLAKLAKLGIHNNMIDWLKSFLTERCIRIKIDDSISLPFINRSGVPQGSNLGPLLFALFFNDLITSLDDGTKIGYADDLKIFVSIECAADCEYLQSLLDHFDGWCRRNKLSVSVSKCSVITFHRKKSPILFDYYIGNEHIKRVFEVNDLGVILDDQLTFNNQRSSVINKANRQLGFISKISREFKDPYCLKSLYCALVRSIIEHAAIVWAPYQLSWILRIERVQKRFIRFALRHLPWSHPEDLPPYSHRCQLLGLDTLERRRKTQQATFVAKMLNGEVQSPNLLRMISFRAPSRTSRSHSLLSNRTHRTSYGYNEPISAMMRIFQDAEHLHQFGEPSSRFVRRLHQSRLFNSL